MGKGDDRMNANHTARGARRRCRQCVLRLYALMCAGIIAQDVRSATTRPADTQPATRPLAPAQPTRQELRSPSFWVERALDAADQVEQPRDRGDQLWRVGVAALDIGRFDLTRRVMARPDLDEQAQGTLAFRLMSAFAEAGDVDRILELAPAVRREFARESAYETVIEAHARRGDLAAAARLAALHVAPGHRRGAVYYQLVAVACRRGDWATAWDLAAKSATDLDRWSSAADAYLTLMEAATPAGRAADVDRAAARAAAVTAGLLPETRDDFLHRLAETLDACGRPELAKAYAAQARTPRPPTKPDPYLWLRAKDQAKTGRFAEALQVADRVPEPRYRAIALADVARIQARARAAPPDEIRRTIARARAAMTDAVQAAEARAHEPGAATRPGGLFDDPPFASDPAHVFDEVGGAVAAAELMVGDVPAAVAMLADIEIEGDYRRVSVLWSVFQDKAEAGDVPWARAIAEADMPWLPAGQRDHLTSFLAAAQVSAKQFPAAEATAAKIESAEVRAIALLDVAKGLAQAGDAAGCEVVLRRADDAAAQVDDAPGPTPRERVAEFQAHLLRPEAVWAKAAAEPRSRRRIDLLLAAAEGLLARQNGKPFRK